MTESHRPHRKSEKPSTRPRRKRRQTKTRHPTPARQPIRHYLARIMLSPLLTSLLQSTQVAATMSASRHKTRLPAPWMRVLAALCAGLVFTLCSAAWSPALHARLHGHIDNEVKTHHDHAVCSHVHASTPAPASDCGTDGESTHSCAVVLLAGGVTTALACLDLRQNLAQASTMEISSHDRVAPARSHHLRPPPHAPPVG